MKSLVLIIGPSGSGKTILEENLCKHYGYRKAVSVTSREKRDHEVNGVDYQFVTKENFLAIQDYIETAEYDGEYYGLTSAELLKDDQDVIAVVEVMGALQINQYIMHRLFTSVQLQIIYMDIPREECAANMEKRGDDPEKIKQRVLQESIPQLFIASHLRADIIETELDEATHRRIGEELQKQKIEITLQDMKSVTDDKIVQ